MLASVSNLNFRLLSLACIATNTKALESFDFKDVDLNLFVSNFLKFLFQLVYLLQ
jgi:hypothetical protein